MFEPIVTERLLLRRIMLEDAEAMFGYRSDPQVKRFQAWRPACVNEARELVESLSSIESETPGSWFQIGLERQVSGELIGDCGLHFLESDKRQVEIGITLAPTEQRHGYATEAVQAILQFLFSELDKHRVFASVDPRNHASIALFERLGMRSEAHFVESVWTNGEWVDDVVFAMLKREWRLKNK